MQTYDSGCNEWTLLAPDVVFPAKGSIIANMFIYMMR